MAKRAATSKKKPVDLSIEHRVVLLKGKERFLMGLHTDSLIAKLREAKGDIEVIRFDGGTDAPADILDECRSFGLLSAHKAIVVCNADEFAKADQRPLVERYVQGPSEEATLILQAETWRPGKLDKMIEAVGAIKACEAVTEPQAMRWAVDRARVRHGGSLAPDGAEELVARVGTDLGRLDSELGKLVSAAGVGNDVNRALVAEMVELSREEAAWQIQGALASGHAARALTKLHELMDTSRIDPVQIGRAHV